MNLSDVAEQFPRDVIDDTDARVVHVLAEYIGCEPDVELWVSIALSDGHALRYLIDLPPTMTRNDALLAYVTRFLMQRAHACAVLV